MASDIDTYLRELQTALAGADPALVQDALFDAEEHLQAEMAAGGEFAAVVEGYGTPAEVAAAYLGTAPAHEAAPAVVAGVTMPETAPETAETTPAMEAAPTIGAPAVAETAAAAAVMAEAGPATEATAADEATTVREVTGQVPGEVPPTATDAGPGMVGAPPIAPVPQVPPTSPVPPTPPVASTPPVGPTAPVGPTPVGVQAGMAAAAAAGAAAPPSVLQQIFGVFADPRVYKALLYMIISLGTGIAYFTIVVTGLSVAAGTLVLIIGIPLFLGVLGIVRAVALFEGRLVELLLGTRMPRRPRAEPPGAGFLQRIWFWVRDGRTWASMAYMILMLPLGIVYFTIAVTGIAVGLSLITAPAWAWIADRTFIIEGVTYEWSPIWAIPLAMIGGALVLIALMHLVKWIGRGHAAFAKALLVRLAK